MKSSLIASLLALLLVGLATSPAWAGGRELSDEELDQVTAGEVETEVVDDVVRFKFGNDAHGKRSVEGIGTIKLKKGALPKNIGSLIIRDGAQGNLNALININAVNSQIQVLINLTVNLHSEVGSIRQINVSGSF